MSAAATAPFPADARQPVARGGWATSLLIYGAFAGAVFFAQGPQPLLGADHISYIKLADTIFSACPDGGYWRELNSVRTLGVLLAYLQGWTGSYVLSMKVVLAVFSIPYLLATELLLREFAPRWQAVLFAIVSSFAVSFGVASWGITDSTALLARTLVAPVVMFSAWLWFRFDGRPAKYAAFPVLVLGSLLHLSAFYMLAVLALVELLDFVFLRRLRIDRRVFMATGALAASMVLLFALEAAGISSRLIGIQVPELLRSFGVNVQNLEDRQPPGCSGRMATGDAASPRLAPPGHLRTAQVLAAAGSAAPAPAGAQSAAASAAEAWKTELALRPWRNMPMPLVNVANVFSSSALILLLAFAGAVSSWRAGFTRADRVMGLMFLAVPIFALGPQTALWVLRSFTSVRPASIEEVRALSLVMIPAFYFVLRLFQRTLASGTPHAKAKAGAIVAAALALPLVMKGLPPWARESILSAMVAVKVVDPASRGSVSNARAALGLTAGEAPLYYSTVGVRSWLQDHTPPGARILTDRDDMILLRGKTIVGPRQVGATTYGVTGRQVDAFLHTSQAIKDRDTVRVMALAREYGVDFAVVPWPVPGALYADESFSVLRVAAEPLQAIR